MVICRKYLLENNGQNFKEYGIKGIYRDRKNQGNIYINPENDSSLKNFMKKHIKKHYGDFEDANQNCIDYSSKDSIKTEKLYKVSRFC